MPVTGLAAAATQPLCSIQFLGRLDTVRTEGTWHLGCDFWVPIAVITTTTLITYRLSMLATYLNSIFIFWMLYLDYTYYLTTQLLPGYEITRGWRNEMKDDHCLRSRDILAGSVTYLVQTDIKMKPCH